MLDPAVGSTINSYACGNSIVTSPVENGFDLTAQGFSNTSRTIPVASILMAVGSKQLYTERDARHGKAAQYEQHQRLDQFWEHGILPKTARLSGALNAIWHRSAPKGMRYSCSVQLQDEKSNDIPRWRIA
ncbi:hypothetical protein [Azospirillum brasilense]|uniref:hypothetical protein n=1 Tax=Azospirillum brasilense TaxID=192 RepID=UPI0013B44D2F|nr:hypothetical protein [Azospirillum brasilense]